MSLLCWIYCVKHYELVSSFNVAPRKLGITFMVHSCGLHYIYIRWCYFRHLRFFSLTNFLSSFS